MYGENENPGGKGKGGPRGANRANPRGLERRRQNPGPKPTNYGGMHDTNHWDGTPSQQIEHRAEHYQPPGMQHPADEPVDDTPRVHPADEPAPPTVPSPMADVAIPVPNPPTPPRWRKKM